MAYTHAKRMMREQLDGADVVNTNYERVSSCTGVFDVSVGTLNEMDVALGYRQVEEEEEDGEVDF
jgi:hypothetical protein